MKDKQKKEKIEAKMAENTLNSIGKFVPGLGKLMEEAKKNPAFKDRLKEVNQEVDRRLRQGLRLRGTQTEEGLEQNFVKSIKSQSKTREIYVDIFDEKNFYKIIAEIPGVEEKDIHIDFKDNQLTLKVDTVKHKYYKKFKVPEDLDGEFKKKYLNGVLELAFKKGGK